MADEKDVFKKLFSVNVNEHTETKKDLTYLSWAWAWASVKAIYPEANYEILRFENGLPYVFDENTGYIVFTKVTIEGITHEMWLPVMDGRNDTMFNRRVEHKSIDKYTKQEKVWYTEPCTMFDVNKTIMRCLTKNLAMFGLGLYIYAGEDLPTDPEDMPTVEEEPKTDKEKLKKYFDKYGKVMPTEVYTLINNALETGSEPDISAMLERTEAYLMKQGFIK